MAGQGGAGLARRHIPQTHRMIPAAHGENSTVGAEGHAGVRAFQDAVEAPGRDVPEPHRPVQASRSENAPAGAERQAIHPLLMTC